MENIDLKFICAYWCNRASPDYEQRFSWSDEEADEIVRKIGKSARDLLVILAKTAPDDHAAAYFAAGPLEIYINLIVREKNADEAAFIENNSYLWRLLPLVWGKVEEIKPLVRASSKHIRFQEPTPEKELKVLDIKELIGFWCRISSSKVTSEFEDYYNQALKKLRSNKSREGSTHDLEVSSPDEDLLKYVKENILIQNQ